MLNKNVCPNCGQIYDPELAKCPLCGTAPQVVETADPVQRKRITEAERKQRRAEKREAEQEARRRRRDARFMADAEEERRIEEEDARRKEEKRRLKEEKKAARRGAEPAPEPVVQPVPPAPGATPAPARDGRGPMPEPPVFRDRRRVPRVFLALSSLVLLAALVVGGSYLLWKLNVVKLPIYDRLAEQRIKPSEAETQPADSGSSGVSETQAPRITLPEGEGVPCRSVTLGQTSLTFETAGDQTQISVTLDPADTTDDRIFTSSDLSVVKVSPVGIVTAVGPGSAIITVSCGAQQAACEVVCDFAEDPNAAPSAVDVDALVLVKDDMTFFAAGENYVLSVTNVPAGTKVDWKSLDESVCTVDDNGHVIAVGEGTTRVVATVGSLTAECWVRCRFK